MSGLSIFMLIVHVLVSVLLIVLVLLQQDKSSGGLASAFGGGGGSSDSVFGGSGSEATFMSKLTTWLAILFMILSLSLAIITAKQQKANVNAGKINIPKAKQNVLPTKPAEEKKQK